MSRWTRLTSEEKYLALLLATVLCSFAAFATPLLILLNARVCKGGFRVSGWQWPWEVALPAGLATVGFAIVTIGAAVASRRRRTDRALNRSALILPILCVVLLLPIAAAAFGHDCGSF
jgi:hypothetical protein